MKQHIQACVWPHLLLPHLRRTRPTASHSCHRTSRCPPRQTTRQVPAGRTGSCSQPGRGAQPTAACDLQRTGRRRASGRAARLGARAQQRRSCPYAPPFHTPHGRALTGPAIQHAQDLIPGLQRAERKVLAWAGEHLGGTLLQCARPDAVRAQQAAAAQAAAAGGATRDMSGVRCCRWWCALVDTAYRSTRRSSGIVLGRRTWMNSPSGAV
jgi:hypothetical protein